MRSSPEVKISPEAGSKEDYEQKCARLNEARKERRALDEGLPEGMTRDEAVEERNNLTSEIEQTEKELVSLRERLLSELDRETGYVVVGDTIVLLRQEEKDDGQRLVRVAEVIGGEEDQRFDKIRPGQTSYNADLSNAPEFLRSAVDKEVFLRDEKGYDFSEKYPDISDTEEGRESEEEGLRKAA